MKKVLFNTALLLSSMIIHQTGYTQSPILPLPKVTDVNQAKALLGEQLFHDKKLSPNGTISCSSCHDLKKGGTDQVVTSTGIYNQKGPINSPTVFNSRFNFVQFWDGRAKDLLEQAVGPVTNPKEMGSNWPYVIKYISSKPAYVKQFKQHYAGNITKATIAEAIVEFEKTLVTPSPFDDFLKGDSNAISEQAKKGSVMFVNYGCAACHSGVNVGGNMYMKLGLVHDYFKARGGEITEADKGRFNVTQNQADMHVFKVPSLRNIELTFPYFHDGSEPSLLKAVKTMAKVQLGRNLSDQDAADIVAFLNSLTGKSLKNNSKP